MTKKISVVIWGNIHRDPSATKILIEFISKANQLGRSILFCEEDFAEQTLENRLAGKQAIFIYG